LSCNVQVPGGEVTTFTEHLNSNSLFVSDKIGKFGFWIKEFTLPAIEMVDEDIQLAVQKFSMPSHTYDYTITPKKQIPIYLYSIRINQG